jgi:hypothetical protein
MCAKGRFRLPFDKLRGAGSMVLYVFVYSFFTRPGEKRIDKRKIRVMRKAYSDL